MTASAIISVLWAFLNSPVGLTIVGGLILLALNRLYASKPSWAKYEGVIMTAIQYAEKAIPDDTPNKGAAKLDAALRYVLKAHQATTGNDLRGAKIDGIREGIQIVHAHLKATGTLQK